MADIKTKDVVKGTIKKINKAAIAADRMRSAYVQTKERQNTQRTPMSIVPRSTPPTGWKAVLTVLRTKRRTSLISRGARSWKKRNGMCPKQRTVYRSFVKSVLLSR